MIIPTLAALNVSNALEHCRPSRAHLSPEYAKVLSVQRRWRIHSLAGAKTGARAKYHTPQPMGCGVFCVLRSKTPMAAMSYELYTI